MHQSEWKVRQAHLRTRSALEWDAMSEMLVHAYDSKDSDLVDQLREPFLNAWRAVTTTLLTGPFAAAGIEIGPAIHPWGIAILRRGGRTEEPLLCFLNETMPDAQAAATVYGGLQLNDFDAVMDDYGKCLIRLLSPDAVQGTSQG